MNNTTNTTIITTFTTRFETRTYEHEGQTLSYVKEIITLPITIKGETREVEFSGSPDRNKATSREVFGCQRGHGRKVHLTSGSIYRHEDGWHFDRTSGYALNSAARIIEWADNVADGAKSQHVGTKFAQEVK